MTFVAEVMSKQMCLSDEGVQIILIKLYVIYVIAATGTE